VLKSNVTDPQHVLVRIPNIQAIRANQEALAEDVLSSLSALLEDADQVRVLRAASPEQSQGIIVNTVHDTIAKRDPELHKAGQWVIAAELLSAVNWPSYSAAALRRAQNLEPEIVNTPSIKALAARTAVLAGEDDVTGVPAFPPERLRDLAITEKTPFTSGQSLEKASNVSVQMIRIPSLRSEGLSLQGDVALTEGEKEAAIHSYREVVENTQSPSGRVRLDRAMQERQNP
jgi:hypothetical protein